MIEELTIRDTMGPSSSGDWHEPPEQSLCEETLYCHVGNKGLN